MKHIHLFILVLIFSTLTACGGGSDGFGGGGSTPPPEEGSTPPPSGEGTSPPVDIAIGSIVITRPNEALVDNEDGTYSMMYTVMVRDQDGSPAPDGVRIELQVVDTVIAMGNITDVNPDTASGTNLSIPGAIQTDNTPASTADNPLADMTIASVTRPGLNGGSIRQIQANDLVIMTGSLEDVIMTGGPESGQVDSRDVIRTIASVPTLANELTISSLYNSSYPNYGGTNYYIAASMLGAGITGEDAEGIPTQAHSVTTGGLGTAKVWITFPADREHIHTGIDCAPAELDDRVSPMGSSQPMFVATSGGISNVRPFCFYSLAGYNLSAIPSGVTYNGGTAIPVTVCARDGGNGGGVSVPYTPVFVGQTTGDAVASFAYSAGTPSIGTDRYTDEYGCFYITVSATGAPGDSATLTAYAGDGSTSIVISLPN